MDVDSFRAHSHFLEEENLQFDTFKLREGKPLSVISRGLDTETRAEEIKEELIRIGCPIRNVSWMRKNIPLTIVSLNTNEAARAIYHQSTCLT